MPYYKVIEELPGGGEVVHGSGLTQDAAAQMCAELNDAWEAENAPSDMTDDEHDRWRERNDPPYWWTEDVQ